MPSTSKWKELVQKYLFLYTDGFFELPYISNSPMAMVESLKNIPVNEYKVLQNAVATNNRFCSGIMRYRQLDEGFWLLATQINIERNVVAKAIYNEDLSSDYYFLTFSVFEYEFPFKNPNSKKNVVLLSTCWTFYKPNTEVATYFYKRTTGKFYNFVFNKKWADENIFSGKGLKKGIIDDFLNKETGFFTWLDIAPKAHDLAKEISQIIDKENSGVFNTADVKKHSLKLITTFFKHSFDKNQLKRNSSLSNFDYCKIAKAEKMILNNLHLPFVGLESIAADVSMSPTKLKSNFKSVFGFSLLQYHKEKNLMLAIQLLKKADIQIQDIAAVTGYESPSKFTASFKKRFKIMPSEFRILHSEFANTLE
ncbi:AraC family transcriptional regulator [Flavobacterium granuli]|uniref:AraC-like DNA-binding protein n=1 Tax=Flavobacterium granuli TaxID=280093 RepID=A0ABU1S2W5_9FLAO|nr:AraC family transcriptional regulator [Flavobacterium granuli]MDR6845372.1 AraC-like DNA-binding protein [Flavobacterium granuli]